MPRVKRGTSHVKRRKNILKATKGYKWGRKNLIRQAKTATNKAGAYALRDRRAKKRDFRRLWQIRLNAAVRERGVRYSEFINMLKKKNVELDRKVLSQLAMNKPELFTKILEKVK